MCELTARILAVVRYVLDVERHAPDLRDRHDRPSLHRLGTSVFPRAALERVRVRDQGEEGSCAGRALASLIDRSTTR